MPNFLRASVAWALLRSVTPLSRVSSAHVCPSIFRDYKPEAFWSVFDCSDSNAESFLSNAKHKCSCNSNEFCNLSNLHLEPNAPHPPWKPWYRPALPTRKHFSGDKLTHTNKKKEVRSDKWFPSVMVMVDLHPQYFWWRRLWYMVLLFFLWIAWKLLKTKLQANGNNSKLPDTDMSRSWCLGSFWNSTQGAGAVFDSWMPAFPPHATTYQAPCMWRSVKNSIESESVNLCIILYNYIYNYHIYNLA